MTSDCGTCFHNYIGDYFQTGAACVPFTETKLLKSCPNNCYGNGNCAYIDSSGNNLDSCFLSSTSCQALCNCDEGFAGNDCNLTTTQLNNVIKVQTGALTNLTDALEYIENRHDLVSIITNTVKINAVNNVINEDLLTANVKLIGAVIDKTASNSIISFSDMAIMSGVVSNMISQSTSSSAQLSSASVGKVQTAILSYADTVGDLGMAELASGTRKTLFIASSSMLVNITKLSSLNMLDSLDSFQPPNELRFLPVNENITLSLSTMRSSLFTKSLSLRRRLASGNGEITSNPLRIKLDCSSLPSGISSEIVLQNNVFQQYNATAPIDGSNKTFACEPDKSFKMHCKYPDGFSHDVNIPCDGKSGNIVSKCPVRKMAPKCSVMSDVGSCSLVSYTSTNITCLCKFCSNDDHRRLAISYRRFAYQVASVADTVFEDFTTTMASAKNLKPANLYDDTLVIYTINIINHH
jgi:hypothetical protein